MLQCRAVCVDACRDDPMPTGLLEAKHGAQPAEDSDEDMLDSDVRPAAPSFTHC